MGTQIDPVIDLNPHYLEEVLRILSLYVPDIDVRAFGSRAKWTAKAYSDLDLALMTKRPLSLEQEAQLREAFDESTIPFKVDFVDWASTSKAFQSIISADSVLIRPASIRLSAETWTVMSLEDALDALLDYRGKTPDKTNVGVPLITAKIVKNGRIEPATEFIAAEKYDEWMTRGLPRVGDVLLTTEAPLGEVAQLHTERVALAQRLVALRGKTGVLDNNYLCYLLQTDEMQEQLAARATGTTVLGIKQSELRKIAVRLPSLAWQRAAVAVLAALDDRITLLRETNSTLEAIAQALFKSWFVDFDPVHAKMQDRAPEGMDEATAALFPDSFEDSELGPVPNGWLCSSIGVLADVIDCLHSKKPDLLDAGRPYLQLNNIRDDGLLDTSELACISDADYEKWTSRIEVCGGDCVITNVGRVGAVAQIPQGFVAAMGRNMTAIRMRKEWVYPTYLIELLQSPWMRAEIETKTDVGTILNALNVKSIPRLRCITASHAVMRCFEDMARPLRAAMEENLREVQTLVSIRDTLLPRLISGQLRVNEALESLP